MYVMCPQQFERLKPVRAAAYDSARRQSCFGDTRAQLLSGIRNWMDDRGGKPIYILYGVAGIGKSTVAKTVAERAAKDGTLAASFFFSRDEDNRKSAKSVFNTLAYHLAYHHPMIAEQINVTLEEDPEVVERDPIQQFNSLIAKPLQTLVSGENPIILLVIDALDECKENDADTILSLFAHQAPQIGRLRIFITARPERHIRSIFTHYRNHYQFHLHDIYQSIVETDIRTYLEFQLSREQVRKALPDVLPPIWQPTTEQMDALVSISGKLFIIAATATSFILDGTHADPENRLAALLDGISAMDFSGATPTTAMDNVYTGIIRAAQPNPVGDWICRFQTCVGAIVLLHDPLPCDALAQLIGIEINVILRTLLNLHSLLAPSADTQTFRVHHKSFPDFLSDPDRCIPQLRIDRTVHNFRIAIRCLHIMDHFLTQNLCGLEPNEWHMDRAQILHRTQHNVSPCLMYACTHWVSHLTAALSDGAELDSKVKELLECFASKHLLTWLEALSIVRHMHTAYTSLDIVCTIGWWSHFPGIVWGLFNDGRRFIQQSPSVLHSFPMQIYDSALTFAPHNTALFRTYSGQHMRNVDVIAGSETDWNPVLAVLKGHTSAVCCVTFTPDGLRLASASSDCTIRLWDGRTGHEITTLAGHAESVNSVSFSPDNLRLASASDDRTIQLWDGRTGHHIATLAGHFGSVTSVTFSPDGLRLASASYDSTVQLWDGRTGCHITTLRGHSNWVRSAAFSPGGSTLASASCDRTIRLWDGRTGRHFATLMGHTDWVNCMAFSPDGLTLASASNDRTIRLWDARMRCCIATTEGHSHWVKSVAFSTDGSRLVSGSYDRTVQLWHGRTGVHIADLSGHSDGVRSVTFSPDGSRLASASDDSTVRLWDSRANSHVVTPQRHYRLIHFVTFSSDGSKLALADDMTIQVSDGATGIHIDTLQGISCPVSNVAFSTDGSKLASAPGSTIWLWNIASCSITILEEHFDLVNSITFSTDGSRLASVSLDKTVRLWDTSTGRCIAILSGHSQSVTSAAFSSDGLRLASASCDKTACLWDSRTGTHIATLSRHSASVNTVKFSADGTTLASASHRTMRLWDGKTGDHIATLRRHIGDVQFITFSADGSRLISGSFNTRDSPASYIDNTVLI